MNPQRAAFIQQFFKQASEDGTKSTTEDTSKKHSNYKSQKTIVASKLSRRTEEENKKTKTDPKITLRAETMEVEDQDKKGKRRMKARKEAELSAKDTSSIVDDGGASVFEKFDPQIVLKREKLSKKRKRIEPEVATEKTEDAKKDKKKKRKLEAQEEKIEIDSDMRKSLVEINDERLDVKDLGKNPESSLQAFRTVEKARVKQPNSRRSGREENGKKGKREKKEKRQKRQKKEKKEKIGKEKKERAEEQEKKDKEGKNDEKEKKRKKAEEGEEEVDVKDRRENKQKKQKKVSAVEKSISSPPAEPAKVRKRAKKVAREGAHETAPPPSVGAISSGQSHSAEQWNPDALSGDAARKSKFLRLLGAGKGGTSGIATPKTSEITEKGNGKKNKDSILKVQNELERQYEAGMKMKHDGGGKRRGLGA